MSPPPGSPSPSLLSCLSASRPVGAEPYRKGVCSFKGCLPRQPYQARDGVCFADCCACTYTGRSVRVWCMNERMNKRMNSMVLPESGKPEVLFPQTSQSHLSSPIVHIQEKNLLSCTPLLEGQGAWWPLLQRYLSLDLELQPCPVKGKVVCAAEAHTQ